MPQNSTVSVNLSAIDRNMRLLRELVGPECGLCPIVKADAYGLGAARIAKRLVESGAEMLAVYSLAQAAALTRTAVTTPVLVLMPVEEIGRTDELYRWLVSGQLHLTVHDERHLETLHGIAERFGATIPVHVEVDTGLRRGGTTTDEAERMIRRIATTRWLRLAGVFTHFSHSRTDEERTRSQLDSFEALLESCGASIPEDTAIHVSSTHSMLRHPRFHRTMVRFGLAWAGYGVDDLEGGEILADSERLEPAVTWWSTVVQLKTIQPGESVGYGGLWTATRRTVLGLVPVGYADGYPPTTAASVGRTPPSVAVVLTPPAGTMRHYAPVVGAVNMDQISIDLTDVMDLGDGPGMTVGIGTRVELITADRRAASHLPKLAESAGTIPHDMLCRLGPGVQRQYGTDVKVSTVSRAMAAALG